MKAKFQSAKLRQLRIKAGVSQAELGKALGHSTPQFISNIERGLCGIPVKDFRAIAKVLKCEPWVFGREHLRDVELHLRNELGVRQ